MLKKLSISLLCGALILPSLSLAAFSDLEESHSNYEAIIYMQDQGIVEGYKDGTYGPDNTINRAEFVKILMEAQYPGQAVVDSCFSDVQQKDWFSDYVCNAKVKGFVEGYDDGTFRPDQEINFVEAAKLINVILDLDFEGKDLAPVLEEESDDLVAMPNPASVYCTDQGGSLEVITDEDGSQSGECTLESGEVCEEWAFYRGECGDLTTEDWFKPYVDTLGEAYAIPTTIDSFDHSITRGEMAEMIYRVKTNNKFKESYNYNVLNDGSLEVEIFSPEKDLDSYLGELFCLMAETDGNVGALQIETLATEYGYTSADEAATYILGLDTEEQELASVKILAHIDDNCLDKYEETEVDPQEVVEVFFTTLNAGSGISVDLDLSDLPHLGDPEAPIVMLEFSDFECPFCKLYFSDTYPLIKENYIDTGKVRYVFLDFPLDFHTNALEAAQAAECARAQGDDSTYFSYHDELFAAEELSSETYESIATDLSLNTAELSQCISDGSYLDEIQTEISLGTELGVAGTPAFFIDGQMVSGAQPYEVFESIIEAKLAELE